MDLPKLTLNNGIQMPALGLGVYLSGQDKTAQAVECAIRNGYRLIDTASKHAVVGLTKSAALEYAPKGIRINAVCPGSVLTPMVERALADEPETMNAVKNEIPLGRLGTAEEIASAILWLSSPGASFMIGHALVVDGGYTAR